MTPCVTVCFEAPSGLPTARAQSPTCTSLSLSANSAAFFASSRIPCGSLSGSLMIARSVIASGAGHHQHVGSTPIPCPLANDTLQPLGVADDMVVGKDDARLDDQAGAYAHLDVLLVVVLIVNQALLAELGQLLRPRFAVVDDIDDVRRHLADDLTKAEATSDGRACRSGRCGCRLAPPRPSARPGVSCNRIPPRPALPRSASDTADTEWRRRAGR